jgi:hypothetical protein
MPERAGVVDFPSTLWYVKSPMAAPAQTAAPICEQLTYDPRNYQFDDLDSWLLRNFRRDDPTTLLRNDLTGWLEAGGCRDISATCLQGTAWEIRFTADECADEAQAERLLRHVARGCRCEIPQIMVIGMGHRFGAMVRLRPIPQ